MTVTYNGRERDGTTPTYGGYSERIVVDENYVLRMPDGHPARPRGAAAVRRHHHVLADPPLRGRRGR